MARVALKFIELIVISLIVKGSDIRDLLSNLRKSKKDYSKYGKTGIYIGPFEKGAKSKYKEID